MFPSSPSTKIEYFDWFLGGKKPTVWTTKVWQEILDFKSLTNFFYIF